MQIEKAQAESEPPTNKLSQHSTYLFVHSHFVALEVDRVRHVLVQQLLLLQALLESLVLQRKVIALDDELLDFYVNESKTRARGAAVGEFR